MINSKLQLNLQVKFLGKRFVSITWLKHFYKCPFFLFFNRNDKNTTRTSFPSIGWIFSTTLISRKEVSASTVKAVSPLPLREEVPPKDVSVPAVRAEAARDPWRRRNQDILASHSSSLKRNTEFGNEIHSPSQDNLCPPPVEKNQTRSDQLRDEERQCRKI